jgi:hypothetical protein
MGSSTPFITLLIALVLFCLSRPGHRQLHPSIDSGCAAWGRICSEALLEEHQDLLQGSVLQAKGTG